MAEYLLPCSCGQKLRVANAQAGGEVACGCGKTLSVPTLRGLRELELAAPAAVAKAKQGWSQVHGLLFAAGLLAVGIGLATAGYCLLRYVQFSGSFFSVDRTADVLKVANAEIDALSPVAALEVWSHEVLEEGLGVPQPPPWVLMKGKIAHYVWWLKLACGLVVVGALLGVGTLYVGRPSK